MKVQGGRLAPFFIFNVANQTITKSIVVMLSKNYLLST